MVSLLTANRGGHQFGLAVDHAAANPNLDTDTAIRGVSLGIGVVNVGTEGVQGGAAFLEVLATGNLGATDTATDGDLDAFGTGTHGRSDGVLDGAAVLDTAFNLLGDVLGHEDGVHLGAFHLADVNLDILASELLELFAEFVDLRAGTTDNQTRTGCIDRHGQKFQGALDINLRDTGFGETGVEVFAYLVVLNQLLFKSSATKPVRIPSADDA